MLKRNCSRDPLCLVRTITGLNVRTLQRRLDGEKSSFWDVVGEQCCRDFVAGYLSNKSYSLLQVAKVLDYSQLSSFARWFTLT